MKIIGILFAAFLAFVIMANASKPDENELAKRGEWFYAACIKDATEKDMLDSTQKGICGTASGRVSSGKVDLSDDALSQYKQGLDWNGNPL